MFDREVAVPELGPDAYVIFGIAEMEKFEADLGDMYLSKIVNGIDASTLSMFRKCIGIMVKDTDKPADQILNDHSFAEVAAWLLDAISVSLHGNRAE